MDYCMGHPGQGHYHYHFLAYGDSENAYDGCLMSCNSSEVGEILGIALDGFPFYGPMQYYSAREGKVYNDPRNCDDCELTQLNAFHTDTCGGIEVADGDASEGGQYRYIISNLFPYNLQCWRGDMSKSQQANQSGEYRRIGFSNKCGVHSEGISGGTWSEEEHGWRGGGCDQFDPEWVAEYGCTAGDCPYSFKDFRNGLGFDFGYPRASWNTFSEVYFKCTAPPTTVEPTTTTEATTTETTTTAGTLPTEPVTIIVDPEPVTDPVEITTRPRSTTTPEIITMPDVTEPDVTRPPAPTGDAGRWQKCEELDGVQGGTIRCAADMCALTCDDGSDPVGPPRTKCLKNDDGTFTWTKDLGRCPIVEPEPTTTQETTTETTTTAGTLATDPVTIDVDPEPTRPTTPQPTRPDSTRPDPTRPDSTTPEITRPDVTEPEATRPPAPVGEPGRWQKCDELDGVRGGTIRCAVDVCALTCDDGSDPIGPPRTKCLKNDDGSFNWNKDLGSCAVPDEVDPVPTIATTPDPTRPDFTTPEFTRPDSTRPDPTRPDSTTPEMTRPDVTEPEATRPPSPVGEPGRWQKCDELDGVRGGSIRCAGDVCALICDDGSDVVDGAPRAKCIKNDDGTFTWNKELGSCPAPDVVEPEPTRPDVTTPEPTRPDVTEPEVTRPEAPAPTGEDGKWQKCDELEGVRGGTIRCAVDICVLTCDNGAVPEGNAKTKCIKNADRTFSWNKRLGTCPAADDNDDGTDVEPIDEEPVDEVGPAPVGEDGKWQKCDELQGVRGGTIRCAVDVCALTCDDGSDPVGNAKTKCIKNADRTFSWNKRLGTCAAGGNDDGTDTEPVDEEPVDEVGPAPVGEDGKWQKCDALEGVAGGKIRCAVDVCALTCDDGSDPVGNAKTKCIKNADRTFSWNKRLGTCSGSTDDSGTDEPEVVVPEPNDDANPGCKDPNTMITDENLSSVCKLNSDGKYQCKLQCADGLFFNGKDGRTNIKLICKCRSGVCKWQNENKKVINKATMSGYTCE